MSFERWMQKQKTVFLGIWSCNSNNCFISCIFTFFCPTKITNMEPHPKFFYQFFFKTQKQLVEELIERNYTLTIASTEIEKRRNSSVIASLGNSPWRWKIFHIKNDSSLVYTVYTSTMLSRRALLPARKPFVNKNALDGHQMLFELSPISQSRIRWFKRDKRRRNCFTGWKLQIVSLIGEMQPSVVVKKQFGEDSKLKLFAVFGNLSTDPAWFPCRGLESMILSDIVSMTR